MVLALFSPRIAGAAENMALDFLLLQRCPEPAARLPRFRHYGWRRPAFTFGYAQKIAWVRGALPATETPFDLCRRPTGGGLVDHRDDWTFALVIPRGHALEELRATESYRLVHAALADALRAQAVAAMTKTGADETGPTAAEGPAGVCFQRAELHDVVDARDGRKIAGAAQKRNKHGLLFQGSVARAAAAAAAPQGGIDWERFESDFTARLADMLHVTPERSPWPELDDEEVSGLTEQYSSPEWLEHR